MEDGREKVVCGGLGDRGQKRRNVYYRFMAPFQNKCLIVLLHVQQPVRSHCDIHVHVASVLIHARSKMLWYKFNIIDLHTHCTFIVCTV